MSGSFDQLKLRAQQWDVAIEQTRETAGSLLAFGVRAGTRLVLKISKRRGDEWNAGEVLRAFDGDGTVRVFEFDAGAMLLERLDPARELVELVRQRNDDAATEALAQVIQKMANHVPPNQCSSVFDWARGFDRYLQLKSADQRSSHEKLLLPALVVRASTLYRELAASQRNTMLLHGDLHHYNVLFDEKRGWVAIDPKGVVGELEYEVGAILRNPVEDPDFLTSPTVIKQRLALLTLALNLDYERVVAWTFAQAVLSVIWDIEDGLEVGPDNASLRLAHAIRPLIH